MLFDLVTYQTDQRFSKIRSEFSRLLGLQVAFLKGSKYGYGLRLYVYALSISCSKLAVPGRYVLPSSKAMLLLLDHTNSQTPNTALHGGEAGLFEEWGGGGRLVRIFGD